MAKEPIHAAINQKKLPRFVLLCRFLRLNLLSNQFYYTTPPNSVSQFKNKLKNKMVWIKAMGIIIKPQRSNPFIHKGVKSIKRNINKFILLVAPAKYLACCPVRCLVMVGWWHDVRLRTKPRGVAPDGRGRYNSGWAAPDGRLRMA